MTPQEIYTPLRAAGLTRAGALGAIGNMMAEAGPQLSPIRVQVGMTNLSDEAYTKLVDAGRIDFADGAGYGLCQWTMSQRKNWLLSFAKKSGVSVGDGPMQISFFIWECREYFPDVWKVLTSSNDQDECSDLMCRVYENPAVKNYSTRRAFTAKAAAETWDTPEDPPADDGDFVVRILQACMAHDGYWPADRVDGIKTADFRQKFIEYAADVAKV